MAVKRNRYYNDPSIGQAFDSLASIFAPPKATDVYAYAKARAERDQNDRLIQLFQAAQDPNFDKGAFDRLGIAAGRFNPNQSYYSVDEGNRVSVQNNAADNTRALRQTELQQQGETTRELLKPIQAGGTRFTPPKLADYYGIEPTQVGVIEAKPGERVFAPDGRTFEGAPKPLSMTEWEAQQAQAAAQRGDINPVDVIMGKNTPVKVAGANGPAFMSPGEAVRTNAPAYVDPGQQGARKDGTALINGRQVPVTRAPNETVWRTADGKEIPGDALVTDMPKPQGTNEQLGLKSTTANQTQATSLGAVLDRTDQQIAELEDLLKNNPGIAGMPGNVRGFFQDIGSVASELTAAFGKDPDAKVGIEGLERVKQIADRVAPTRDPNIRKFNSLMFDLAYSRAQMNNPTGEVSQQALLRSIESLGANSWLSTNQSVLEGLAGIRETSRNMRQQVNSLRAPTPGAPAAAPSGRMRFDENGNPIQ